MASYDFDNKDDYINSLDVNDAIDELETEIEDLDSDIEELEEEKEELDEKRADEEDEESIEGFNDDIKEIEKKIKDKEEEKENLKEELEILTDLQDEFEGYCDWKHGETLIRWNRIDDYLRDELEDCGYIPKDFPSWIEIDWESTFENMKQDYTSGQFDGVEYWVRSS